MACVITKEGIMRIVKPTTGNKFSLEELQSYVGGYIECVHFHDNKLMVVNEEGKLKNLGINEIATCLYRRFKGTFNCIVGDVIVINTNELD